MALAAEMLLMTSNREYTPLAPSSGNSELLLNDYVGWYFNGIDDLTVDPVNGDIWFTDNDAAWDNGIDTGTPVLPSQSYIYRPFTGLTTVVEDTLKVPNSIVFSPDGKTCYISDTGSVSTNLLQQYPGYQDFNVANHHAV
jgi:gluconolactonase